MLDNDVDFGSTFDRPLKFRAWNVACRENLHLVRPPPGKLNFVQVIFADQNLSNGQDLTAEGQWPVEDQLTQAVVI